MDLFVITGIVIVTVILFVVILAVEQHDKEKRKKNGLPPKKYHDITDYDITTIETIHHK